jgi:hypothetical protein
MPERKSKKFSAAKASIFTGTKLLDAKRREN